jgi:hypothetical protein
MQLLQTLAAAAASSATAGSDVTTSSFVTGALCELSAALVKENTEVYREALHVYATACGTAARAGATVHLSSVVPVVVCCAVAPTASSCLCAVVVWSTVRPW